MTGSKGNRLQKGENRDMEIEFDLRGFYDTMKNFETRQPVPGASISSEDFEVDSVKLISKRISRSSRRDEESSNFEDDLDLDAMESDSSFDNCIVEINVPLGVSSKEYLGQMKAANLKTMPLSVNRPQCLWMNPGMVMGGDLTIETTPKERRASLISAIDVALSVGLSSTVPTGYNEHKSHA